MAKSKEVITTETAYQNFPVDDDGNATVNERKV